MNHEQELYVYKWTSEHKFYSQNNVGWINAFFKRFDDKYTIVYNTMSLKGSNIKLFKNNDLILSYRFNRDLKCNITMSKLKRIHEIMEKFIK